MRKHSVTVSALAAIVFLAVGCAPANQETTTQSSAQTMVEGGLSTEELELRLAMRELWNDHVWYTRDYINSVAADLPDQEAVAGRLLRNQDEIGGAIKPYYGDEAGNTLTELLREHIMIATEVVAAAKAGDSIALDAANAKWNTNADQIADLLAAANTENWRQSDMRAMMRDHLKLTTDEAVARLQGDWKKNVEVFDQVQNQALRMADMLSDGIIAQHPDSF